MIYRLFYRAVPLLIVVMMVVFACSSKKQESRVLVFVKTAGFHHQSIGAGIAFVEELGKKHSFLVDTTTDASLFYEENLKRYNAVIFLSTTGDVLNSEQQNNFERYIEAGGGYVGVHAAADTEYDWPWYGKLVGAYFKSHPGNPNVRKATYDIVDASHPATDSLPKRWERTDEFYNYKNINPDVKTLITLDEKTYEGGENGDFHPAAWYHEYDGGRAFYTAMGHTEETYAEPLFEKHFWGGLKWVLNDGKPEDLNYSKVSTKRMPAENRFTKVVLEEQLDEPVEIALLPNDRILFIQRRGGIRLFDPAVGKSKEIGRIAVSTEYTSGTRAEDGLLGLAIDPHYSENNWIYLYYSPAGSEAKNILTRYELKGDEFIESSKKVILEVATQRAECCHTGGSIAFDAHGNLFLSTGDNTNPFATAYAPIDEQPGRSPWDAQKSSSNTNDLRGKILRIHPEADGTYTIPDGNLFPKGTDKTRGEIYVMGNRNPYRISVDQHTGYVYWGDVGPDAAKDSIPFGPKGHDEVGQARKPGYYGWPYFIGNNKPYIHYDYATNTPGKAFDPAKPINESPNNTGLRELPPAQDAFIWYPYKKSTEFPLVGEGGRTAMAGPVYYADDFAKASRHFPDYYDGKLFIYEWMRGWIMSVTMDKDGNYLSMERFMPSYTFSSPMDMEFSKETGDLYMLEYGTGWFTANNDARLVRIEYTEGNRKPHVQIAADNVKNGVPMTVHFNSEGTKDFDYDDIKYTWTIKSSDGKDVKSSTDKNIEFTFDKPGIYTAQLAVTDAQGATGESTMEIFAGNEAPSVSFTIRNGNSTFFFPNKKFDYEVNVTDKEDGTLASGIDADQVAVSIDYLAEGYDKIAIAQGHQQADASAAFATGKKLMEGSDCKACHSIDKKSVGPMFVEVVKKYKGDAKAVDYLAKKIINGGGGVWGENSMAAHPQLSMADATEIVKYIMTISDVKPTQGTSLPVNGSYTTLPVKGTNGVYILRAAYTDKSVNGLPSTMAQETMVLRNPTLSGNDADKQADIQKYTPDGQPTIVIGSKNNAYLAYNAIDLTNINAIQFKATASQSYGMIGGTIAVHLDSPTGTLIGETPVIKPSGGGSNPAWSAATAKLQATTGKHDLYFVIKNDDAKAGQMIVALESATVQAK